MNTRQHNTLEMGHTVCDYLSNNETVTNAIVAFPAAFTRFSAVLDEAEALAQLQARRLRAIIEDRDRSLDAMRHATLALAGMALTYADQNDVASLASDVRVTDGDFNRSRLAQQPRLARQVLTALRAAQPQLEAHGVTVALLDDLQAKIEAAEAALPTPRTLRAQKKAATDELQLVIDRLNRILHNQLDVLLQPLARKNVGFHLGYLNARKIINNPGVRHDDEDDAVEQSTPAPTATAAPESKAA
jgi:hypothetical protein